MFAMNVFMANITEMAEIVWTVDGEINISLRNVHKLLDYLPTQSLQTREPHTIIACERQSLSGVLLYHPIMLLSAITNSST